MEEFQQHNENEVLDLNSVKEKKILNYFEDLTPDGKLFLREIIESTSYTQFYGGDWLPHEVYHDLYHSLLSMYDTDEERDIVYTINMFQGKLKNKQDVIEEKSKYTYWHSECASHIEAKMYNSVVKNGLTPMVNPYAYRLTNEILPAKVARKRLDQVYFYHNKPILLIELDGKDHEKTIKADAEREKLLVKAFPDLQIIRFDGWEVHYYVEKCAELIKRAHDYLTKVSLLKSSSRFSGCYADEIEKLKKEYQDIEVLFETFNARYYLEKGKRKKGDFF